MEKIKAALLPAACALVGIAMISTAVYNREEFDVPGFVGSLFFGLFFLGAGALFFFLLTLPAWREKGNGFKKEVRNAVFPDREGKRDEGDAASLVASFRASFREYFASPGLPENSALQSDVTQLFWHVLHLKKRRMERLGVSLDFESSRRTYGGKSLEESARSDAKYDVTEVRERIDALRVYSAPGRKPCRKRSTELAHYVIAAARTKKRTAQIICPNCGAVTTRENLLDGCDYCGSRFRIEDLGKNVSGFALRDDRQTALDKYRDLKSRFGLWVTLAVTIPVFLLSLFGMFSVWGDMDAGFGMKLAAVIFGAVFLAGIAWFAARFLFQLLFDPILERIDSVAGHYAKKALEERKKHEEQNEAIFRRVRERDRYFSEESFFGGVQNKLAAVRFAESAREAAVFAAVDLRDAVERYRNVADADVVEMRLTGYERNDARETIRMEVLSDLLTAEETGFRKTGEKLALTMFRNPSALTEAACPPTVFLCGRCGRSLDLLKGGRCEYCGASLNLFNRDWIIGEYRILS